MKNTLFILVMLICATSCTRERVSVASPQKLVVPPGCVSESSVSLLWDPSSDPTIQYVLYRDGAALDTVSITNYLVKGLNPNQSYEFYLKAMSANGRLSEPGNVLTITTKQKGEVFDVIAYGAVGDGKVLNTKAIQKAINACTPGGTVYIPQGTFLSGALFLKSDMTLYIEEGGVLKGSTDIEDYSPMIRNRFEGWELETYASLITAGQIDHEGGCNVHNLRICGKGTISGGGKELGGKMIKAAGMRGRGRLICLMNCQNVDLQGLIIKDSPCWTIHYIYCKNVAIHDLDIRSTVLNGDGIDPDSSVDSYIYNCKFSTTDDCIAIKSGKNPEGYYIGKATENVLVAHCNFVDGHGISIGTEMSGGVKNVVIRDCQTGNLLNGLQIKVTKDRGGYVEKVKVTNCALNKIKIITSVNYNNDGEPAPKLPYLKDMEFSNLDMRGGETNSRIIYAEGYEGIENYTGDIVFKDIRLPEQSIIALNYCKNITFENVVSDKSNPEYKITNSTDILK